MQDLSKLDVREIKKTEVMRPRRSERDHFANESTLTLNNEDSTFKELKVKSALNEPYESCE